MSTLRLFSLRDWCLIVGGTIVGVILVATLPPVFALPVLMIVWCVLYVRSHDSSRLKRWRAYLSRYPVVDEVGADSGDNDG